jgi:hypothetical protein
MIPNHELPAFFRNDQPQHLYQSVSLLQSRWLETNSSSTDTTNNITNLTDSLDGSFEFHRIFFETVRTQTTKNVQANPTNSGVVFLFCLDCFD